MPNYTKNYSCIFIYLKINIGETKITNVNENTTTSNNIGYH